MKKLLKIVGIVLLAIVLLAVILVAVLLVKTTSSPASRC